MLALGHLFRVFRRRGNEDVWRHGIIRGDKIWRRFRCMFLSPSLWLRWQPSKSYNLSTWPRIRTVFEAHCLVNGLWNLIDFGISVFKLRLLYTRIKVRRVINQFDSWHARCDATFSLLNLKRKLLVLNQFDILLYRF
jgi:hypothetical protein